MATAYIRMGGVMGGGAPVYTTAGRYEDITTSGTSAASTMVAQAGDMLTVGASGGSIRIAIGPAPTALSNGGMWVADGQRVDIGPLSRGDKVAVIDAA